MSSEDVIVSGFTKQITPFRPLPIPKCNSKVTRCEGLLWQYGKFCCGPGCIAGILPKCSNLNPTICPNIAGGANSTFLNDDGNINPMLESSVSPNTIGNVRCNYKLTEFKLVTDVQGWINKFGSGDPTDINDPLNKKILPFFCSQSSRNCVIDPTTGKPMPKCTNLRNTGEAGRICRNWANISANRDIVEATKQNACLINNTPDCACMNRSGNRIYQIVKKGNPFNDGCWFIPCSNPETYIVPQELINPACPNNICQVINNIVDNSGTNINTGEIEQTISCPIGGGGAIIPNNSWRWLVIGGIILILIIFIIVVAFANRKK
uniref:Entry-fusion-complex G9/A16 n=1 Tax=Pithovirus LCPAC104 TaxID=2506589 RepID=A0A481Z3T1_9VIRU|nr:MAG: entry-fusion-complex G9/A16 [Pithovirus LCPAC104]